MTARVAAFGPGRQRRRQPPGSIGPKKFSPPPPPKPAPRDFSHMLPPEVLKRIAEKEEADKRATTEGSEEPPKETDAAPSELGVIEPRVLPEDDPGAPSVSPPEADATRPERPSARATATDEATDPGAPTPAPRVKKQAKAKSAKDSRPKKKAKRDAAPKAAPQTKRGSKSASRTRTGRKKGR